MRENHACMNFPLSVSAEGAPVYEQKGAAQAAEGAESAILRMARAERTVDFTVKLCCCRIWRLSGMRRRRV